MATFKNTSKGAAAELQAAQVERLRLSLSQAANGAFGIANILDAARKASDPKVRDGLHATAAHFSRQVAMDTLDVGDKLLPLLRDCGHPLMRGTRG
jgi:hypothetical protein